MESEDELRKRWLNRYLTVQAKADTKVRSILVAASQDAMENIEKLGNSSTFSAGVRTAQLKLITKEVKDVLKDVFNDTTKVIRDSDRAAATSAVTAFAESDRSFLEAAFRDTGRVASYISSQKQSAALGVLNTVSRITKSDFSLSQRVYRSETLANGWVKKQVNLGLVQNESAAQIAKRVRSSIRPNTAGGVSYAAMRLGRTEINNAFHATSVMLAQDRPWVTGMGWHLSSTHKHEPGGVIEICEKYSHQTFTTENVPKKPHPQCRCFVVPEVEEYSSFLAHLTAGQYKGWIENAA